MKKIKVMLLTAAVLVALTGAFAARDPACADKPQFYKVGWFYYPAGEYGRNFFCWGSAGTCTYVQPHPITNPYEFVPCRTGAYLPIF